MKIIVKNQKTASKKEFTSETPVTTTGELFAQFDAQGVEYKGQKVMLRNNSATLESPNYVLPQEDLIVYIFPTKNESGLEAKDFLDESGKASGTRIVHAVAALSKEIEAGFEKLLAAIEGSSDEEEDFKDEEEDTDDIFDDEEDDNDSSLSQEDLDELEAFKQANL